MLATVHYDILEEDVQRVMMSLVKVQNLESIHELYSIHSQDILEILKVTYKIDFLTYYLLIKGGLLVLDSSLTKLCFVC